LISKFIHPKCLFLNPQTQSFGLIHHKFFHMDNYTMALNSISEMDSINRRFVFYKNSYLNYLNWKNFFDNHLKNHFKFVLSKKNKTTIKKN
jgi:hypothetical protein